MLYSKILNSVLVLSLLSTSLLNADNAVLTNQQILFKTKKLKAIVETQTKISDLGIDLFSETFETDINSTEYDDKFTSLKLTDIMDLNHDIKNNLLPEIQRKLGLINDYIVANLPLNISRNKLNADANGLNRYLNIKKLDKSYEDFTIPVAVVVGLSVIIIKRLKPHQYLYQSLELVKTVSVAGSVYLISQAGYFLATEDFWFVEKHLNNLSLEQKVELYMAFKNYENNLQLLISALETNIIIR